MKVRMLMALAVVAAPALAQSQPETKKDPNRKVCETIEETGSRVGGRRVCMTAQQWDDRRRTDREGVENVQNTRTEPSGH